MTRSVLFVCTANICRSPLAEGLLKILVKDDLGNWRIESAGIWAFSQAPAAENTLWVLRERGVDLSDHASRVVTEKMVEEFNLILAMERNHKEALQAAFPAHRRKIFLLHEMNGTAGDVADPIGYPIEIFEETAEEIEGILTEGFSRIANLAEGEVNERK